MQEKFINGVRTGALRALDRTRIAKMWHITLMTKERLLRAAGHDLEDVHYTMAMEPERVGSPETQLLILLGRKRGCGADTLVCKSWHPTHQPVMGSIEQLQQRRPLGCSIRTIPIDAD
jgi:hypothetical protein